MTTPHETLDFVLRSIPDFDETVAAVQRRAHSLPPGTAVPTEILESAGPGRRAQELAGILAEAPGALERAASGAPPRTRREQFVLEAIVQLEGRPAIRVRDGTFDAPPSQWRHLEDCRAAIEGVIASVGRVQAEPPPQLRWLATAFMVGPGILMTNRHVAASVATSDGGVAWTFTAGVTADFVAEEPEAGTGLAVIEILGIHDEYDLALLRLEERADNRPPLSLAGTEPAELDGGDVYVVGHPVPDGTRNDSKEMKRLFAGLYRVKCVQPGKGTGVSVFDDLEVLGHDCSTLGGNSGSCLVDLKTGLVAGLHFRGRYREINHAVPLWRLADDPLLAAHGVTFA
jgi:hypothetical protein